MQPYFQESGITLYHGDCRELLPSMENGSVNGVITDPPFGIGFKYASHDDTPDGYGEWLWEIIEKAESLCAEGSPIFVFQAMLNVRHFTSWFPRNWRIYAAAKNFVQIRPTVMQYSFDPVVCWWTEGKAWTEGTASRDFYVADTASQICNRNNIEKGHPCPRPLGQIIRFVEQWVFPNGVVLDPFTGSGTTGVACARLGRQFIGCEIEERYIEIAAKRISKELAQGKLFEPQITEPARQMELVA